MTNTEIETKSIREELDDMKKENGEVAHMAETSYEATKSIVQDIITVGKDLTFFRKKWKEIKPILDTNKDGKIQVKELFNPWFLKLILITFLGLFVGALGETILTFVISGDWSWVGIVEMFNTIGIPFLIGLAAKFLIDDYDGRLKAKDLIVTTLKETLQTERLNKVNDDNKHEISMTQLVNSLDLKNIEIDWLNKYGLIPAKEPPK